VQPHCPACRCDLGIVRKGFRRAAETSLKSLHDGPRIPIIDPKGNGTTEALPVALLMSVRAEDDLSRRH
jgi:hypothetical protein